MTDRKDQPGPKTAANPTGRFSSGQSGNPQGRPKGSQNKRTILKTVLFETISVRRDGRTIRMSAIDIMHEQLINKAGGGDRRAMKIVFKWSDYTGALQRFEPPGKTLSGVVTFAEFKAATGIDPDSEEFWISYRRRRGIEPRQK